MSNALNKNDAEHISALGRKAGPMAFFYGLAVPVMLAAFWVMGVAMFAPAPMRPALAIWVAVAALAVFLAFPVWYFRGLSRWVALGLVVLVLVVSAIAHIGVLKAVVALWS